MNVIIFRDNAAKYKAHRDKCRSKGQKDPSAAQYFNCVEDPLLDGDDDEEVLDRVPPPELHLHEGIVNKLVSVLNEKWVDEKPGENNFWKWCGRKNIIVQYFRGKSLNGNECRDVLELLDDLAACIPAHLMNFIDALRAFNLVRKSCFGEDLLDSYVEDIANFKAAYLNLGINVTSKAHIVFHHVADFCRKGNKGLGFYSEQTG